MKKLLSKLATNNIYAKLAYYNYCSEYPTSFNFLDFSLMEKSLLKPETIHWLFIIRPHIFCLQEIRKEPAPNQYKVCAFVVSLLQEIFQFTYQKGLLEKLKIYLYEWYPTIWNYIQIKVIAQMTVRMVNGTNKHQKKIMEIFDRLDNDSKIQRQLI